MNVLMIPAKNVCYPGWHLEYNGYLVAERYTHEHSIMFECLNGDPETIEAGYRNENGALMYPIVTECGSLSCPNYPKDKQMASHLCCVHKVIANAVVWSQLAIVCCD